MPPTRKALAEWEVAGASPDERPRTWFRMAPVIPREDNELDWTVEPMIALARSEGWTVDFEPIGSTANGACIPDLKTLTINNRSTSSVNKRALALVHESANQVSQAASRSPMIFTVCGSLGSTRRMYRVSDQDAQPTGATRKQVAAADRRGFAARRS